MKAMEEMSLKTNEINSLERMIQSLEATNKTALITTTNHEQKAIILEEQMKSLQKEPTFTEHISYIKNHLWKNVIEPYTLIGLKLKSSMSRETYY